MKEWMFEESSVSKNTGIHNEILLNYSRKLLKTFLFENSGFSDITFGQITTNSGHFLMT